jgi:hypothetical protein
MSTDTMLITSNNTPYQSDEDKDKDEDENEEKEKVTYHSNPESIRQLNPKRRVEQAWLFCSVCKQWKKLSATNITTIDYSLFSWQKQYYTSGICLTDECYADVERHLKACQKAEEQEERFWKQVDVMQRKCDESARRCDAIWKKGIKEQELNSENKK